MKREIKINKYFGGYSVGEIVSIECDKDGVPLVREWRNRVNDATVDNCVEFVGEKSPVKTKTSKPKTRG